jgi:ATP-dependent DNA ligase
MNAELIDDMIERKGNIVKFPTLYKIDSSNQVNWWRVEADPDLNKVHIYWQRGDGEAQYHADEHTDPENEARRRTRVQMERKGYTLEIPTKPPQLPMLAQKWDDHYKSRSQEFEYIAIQPKLDGHRCVANRSMMLSRRRDRIVSVPHIQHVLSYMDPSILLDGELYIHKVPLQSLQSFVRRDYPHPDYLIVEYHVFDICDEDLTFEERFDLLCKTIKPLQEGYKDYINNIKDLPSYLKPKVSSNFPVKIVPTTFRKGNSKHPDTTDWISQEFRKSIEAGFEGLMIRNADSYYRHDYRSPNLLKYKEFQDEEFIVVDIMEVSGGLGLFVCKTDKGQIFEVTPAWTHPRRKFLLENKESYIGKWLHVTFEKYSLDGIPLKPIGRLTYDSRRERQG